MFKICRTPDVKDILTPEKEQELVEAMRKSISEEWEKEFGEKLEDFTAKDYKKLLRGKYGKKRKRL